MSMPQAKHDAVVTPVLAWYGRSRRPLPWRQADVTPWGVLVSEFMLQQTQVQRVVPIWNDWLARWPAAADLAGAPMADVLRAWGGLGYPRRARALHGAATIIRDEHDGVVPQDAQALRALPGVGEYTAAAVRAFAFGLPSVVLDTNVRRVLVRVAWGQALPTAHLTAAERALAAQLADHQDAAEWAAASMELGALVCTARNPDCSSCPIRPACAWHQAGQPAPTTVPRRQARFAGSDRQARGRIMALLRSAAASVSAGELAEAWPDAEQRDRAVAGLLADGLLERTRAGGFRLPS